jgi:hypothetical protein
MVRKLLGVAIAVAGLAASACAGRMGGGSAAGGVDIIPIPQTDSDMVMFATVKKDTIGEELPSEGLGTIHSDKWKATLGGFTQERYSQSLGFKPHIEITILNLSKNITHTFNVVKEIKGPPADFPKDPNLSIKARGGHDLKVGYASGPIKPGKSVKVTLVKAGTYLVGCAFHYHSGMHDVLVVEPHAAEGPQATPPPKATGHPTSRSSYDP